MPRALTPAPDGTCPEQVSNGPRTVSFHPCARPIKADGLCGVHLAAKRKREQNAQADQDRRDASRQRQATALCPTC